MEAAIEASAPPLLLEEQKMPSLTRSISQLPAAAARQAIKHIQWLLSSPNSHIGRPFLEGNFAPVSSEVFAQNLPLLTATGVSGADKPHIATGKLHTEAPGVNFNHRIHDDLATARDRNPQAGNSTGIHWSDSASSISSSSSSGPGTSGAPSTPASDSSSLQDAPRFDAMADIREFTGGASRMLSPAGPEDDTDVGDTVTLKLHGAAVLPDGLSGAFLRLGPNPYLKNMGGYHWFDGDGMVHAVRIKDGSASYCNRWVPTSRLKQEMSAGWPLFPRLGDYVGLRGVALMMLTKAKVALGLIDGSEGGGNANTAMITHASRLLALSEGDLPYAVRLMCDGLLEAVGRVTVSGPVGKSFTAHPKLDAVTGELHFFRYTFDAPPFVSYGVLGPDGNLTKTLHITEKNMPRPVMMHDFAITENYVLFLDNPLCFDGERMVKQGNLPFSFKASEGSRIGLLRRGAAGDTDMIWFKLPAHMVFHVANAWEEPDGKIKLFVAHHWSISLNLDSRSSGKVPEDEQPHMAVITLDVNSPKREGSIKIMTKTVGDFPVIHPRFVGRKNRYTYVATMVTDCGDAIKWDGVAKIDLWAEGAADAAVAVIKLPPGCYNGETVFVPRYEDPKLCTSEDDGYLITYVHDESSLAAAAAGSSGSSLVIWDALTMNSQPLAVIQLPARVPYGFHAHWMTESQVQQQIRGNPLATMPVRD